MLQHISLRKSTLPILMLLAALVVSGCGAAPTPVPTPEIAAAPLYDSKVVVAEGRVLPAQYANIAFMRDGEVVEIIAKEGARLKKGDPIARLKADKSLEAGLTLAQQELIDAEQELEDVKKNEEVDRAAALKAVADSSDALRKAKSANYNYTVPPRVGIYSMFEAADKMNDKVKAVRTEYEPYKDQLRDSMGTADLPATFCMPSSLCRGTILMPDHSPARDLREKLSDAEGDLAIALSQIRIASNLALAEASLAKAQKDAEKVADGPDVDKLSIAETRLKRAEYQLEEANKRIQDLELRAPFDGTVARIDLKIGEKVSAGRSVARFADLSHWIVETNNLTEIQVVKIDEDQEAQIVADALPDDVFTGKVETISRIYEEDDGDITYMVRIALPDTSPKLRWGMTVVATLGE